MSDTKDTVEVVDSQGRFGTVAKRDLETGLKSGAIRIPTEDDYKAYKLRQETTTPVQKGIAGVEGTARALSFGASDWVAQKAGLTTPEMQQARKENNPNISATGEAVGYVAPLLIPGGATGALARVGKAAGAVPRAISKAGLAAEEAVAGRMALTGTEKLASRIVKTALPKAAGSAVEGAIIGGQQAITESVLGDHELTASSVLGHMGTGALLGFGAGGALGAAAPIASALGSTGKQVAKNILKIAKLDTTLEDVAQTSALRAAKVKPAVFERTPEEVMKRAAQDGLDEGVIHAQSTPSSIAAASKDKMRQYGSKIGDALDKLDATDKRFAPTVEQLYGRIEKEVLTPMRETSLGAQEAAKLENRLQPFLAKMAESPNVSFKQLFKERVGFQDAINYERANPNAVTIGLKKVRNILDDELQVSGDKAAKAIGDGTFLKDYLDAKSKYRSFSILNKASEKAASQDAARSAMPGFGDMLIGGIATGAGALATGGMGAIPAIATAGALSKGVQIARSRADAVIAGVLDKAAKSSKIADLEKASNAFSSSLRKSVTSFFAGAPAVVQTTKPLWTQKEAKQDIEQTKVALSNMDAIQNSIAQHTAAVSEAAPTVAMHMQMQARSGAEFLAKSLPVDRNPARLLTPNASLEPHYSPSDVDRFMRYRRAVLNPKTVIEDMNAGHLSPDSVTALKAVYPALYKQIANDAMEAVASAKHAIPYNKRVQLSILLGKALDPSLQPQNMQLLQSRFGTGAQKPQQGAGKQNKAIQKSTAFAAPMMMDNLYRDKK